MAVRRRNSLPPYEVMGQASRVPGARAPGSSGAAGSSGSPGSPEPTVISRAPSDRSPQTGDPLGGSWLDRAHKPMRVPQIMFVWLLLFLIVALAVAYWVGKARGQSIANAEAQARRSERAQVERNGVLVPAPDYAGVVGRSSNNPGIPPIGPAPAARTPSSGVPTGTTAGTTPRPRGVEVSGTNVVPANPPTSPGQANAGVTPVGAARPGGIPTRQPGLNYMVLATLPEEEAQTLAAFLREHGVDAGAFARHNGRSFQVIALRGFSREQLAGPAKMEFEKELRRLGRVWKDQKNGATNLADMYMDLYKEDPTAATPPTNRKPTR